MSKLDSIESVIIHGLLYVPEYNDKVIPFIKKEYFQSPAHQTVFEEIHAYINKYNKAPSTTALNISLQNSKVSANIFKEANELLDALETHVTERDPEHSNDDHLEWLSDSTEKWCQDSAFYNVLVEAADAVDGIKDNVTKSGMPEKMAEALAICFDTNVGHDYFADAEQRFEERHKLVNRVGFNIDMFNRITKGGQPRKTLSVLMSSITGGFKSGTMCSLAAGNLMDGKNVLYITMELAEEVVAERIDANLLKTDLDDLILMTKSVYLKAVERNKSKTQGKLIVREYPTGGAHSGHFRFLIKELKAKNGFVPDMIYIDYLNICSSAKLPPSAMANSYLYIKTIAEELRALAVEFEVPIMSATQGNRGAAGASDVSISDISESYGLTHVVDMLLGVITTPELDEMNQIMFKQLKNRFADINKFNVFSVGVNKAQMCLYDLDKVHKTAQPIATGGYKVVDVEDHSEPSDTELAAGYSRGPRSTREKFQSFKV